MKCYEGSEPYIFLSYAHKNTDMVMPVFRGLDKEGFRIWYDAGTEPGTEWPEYIAEHLERASCCICFLTQEFLDSKHCRRELNFALSENIPVLAVHMEEFQLTAGMKMQLGLTQAMFRYRAATETEFLRALYGAKMLCSCRKMIQYSQGLEFEQKDDGNYAVMGIGSCKDTALVIPPVLPDGGKVVEIAECAFEKCNELVSVTIPNSIRCIGPSAFWGCTRLSEIVIPNGVECVSDYAFSMCIGLKMIRIPSSVMRMGREVIRGLALSPFRDYACTNNVEILCEHPSQPPKWNEDWNPDNRPVVWNYKPENN